MRREILSVSTRLDWLDPFLTVDERDRLLGWQLGVSLYQIGDGTR